MEAPVNNRGWIELLHAEACWVLAQAGLDVLVVKGPSLTTWLYPEGGRESADVDLLVRPAHWDRAVHALLARRFFEIYAGTRVGETATHSLDLQRHDSELGSHTIDLHRHYPGIDLEPAAAFDLLWKRREPGVQAGVHLWFPDMTARALMASLHAAREPFSPKAAEDQRRALASFDIEQLADLSSLAAQLDAQVALRAGLETHPESAPYVHSLGLAHTRRSAFWELQSHGASRTSVRLEQLQGVSWRRRPAQVARWLFPTPALIRIRDTRAAGGTGPLLLGYARRLRDGLRELPLAIREVRRAKRNS